MSQRACFPRQGDGPAAATQAGARVDACEEEHMTLSVSVTKVRQKPVFLRHHSSEAKVPPDWRYLVGRKWEVIETRD